MVSLRKTRGNLHNITLTINANFRTFSNVCTHFSQTIVIWLQRVSDLFQEPQGESDCLQTTSQILKTLITVHYLMAEVSGLRGVPVGR